MKLKNRIKRALAGFLKDELLDYVSPQTFTQELIHTELDINVINLEVILDRNTPDFPDRVRQIKEDFAKSILQNIKIDVMDNDLMVRRIRYSLYIAKPK